ncbi:TPA: VOC family protein [Pseudomonas aeruginosa]|uniref:VOC family protein n=1 Tax=Pseudomonas aeruginosa TaxID=287 RepID=UPI00057B2619|nr:VOC family protein [Pseudomonas aeruginosa]
MSDESANPSCISHLSIGTNDFPRARAFYDTVMAALGCKVILEYPGAVAYGKLYPEFWVQAPIDAFHAAALAAGARDEGAPGPRPLYGEPYYGCFIRDLDGHKVEASYWDMSQGFDAHDHAH